MATLLFSGKHDPEAWLPSRQIGVAGLRARLLPGTRIVEFYRRGRAVRVTLFQVLTHGEPWVIRKLIRFRRYVKRMERA